MRSAQELVAAKRASLTGMATLEGQVEQLVGQVQALQRSYATTRENLARRSDALSHANLTSSRLEEELRTVNEELAWQVAGRAADKEAHCASLSVVQNTLAEIEAHESGKVATLRAALQSKASKLSEMQAEMLRLRVEMVNSASTRKPTHNSVASCPR
jgi:chromosome segregation ATPase